MSTLLQVPTEIAALVLHKVSAFDGVQTSTRAVRFSALCGAEYAHATEKLLRQENPKGTTLLAYNRKCEKHACILWLINVHNVSTGEKQRLRNSEGRGGAEWR